jgi:FAD/FMN-containing dehydrogenase
VTVSVLHSRLKEILDAAQSAAEANSLAWAAIARGVGVACIALLPPDQNPDTFARVQKATNAIHQAAAKLDANSTIPWCPTPWKPDLHVWGLDPRNISQMKKLKNVFDPQNVLSPGRFVGGI